MASLPASQSVPIPTWSQYVPTAPLSGRLTRLQPRGRVSSAEPDWEFLDRNTKLDDFQRVSHFKCQKMINKWTIRSWIRFLQTLWAPHEAWKHAVTESEVSVAKIVGNHGWKKNNHEGMCMWDHLGWYMLAVTMSYSSFFANNWGICL